MKKRLALLGLALIFILGSVFGGAFAPLLANYVANASNALHNANVANYRIENLPRRDFNVGDAVPANRPWVSSDVRFIITRQSGNNHIVVGVSHLESGDENSNLHPAVGDARHIGTGFTQFLIAGIYTYRFFNVEEYNKLEFREIGGHQTGMVYDGNITGNPDHARSFHTYSVTVYSTDFRIELPSNNWDIFPNITIPNPSSALTTPADVITPITLPLPESVFDMQGRDLLYINTDENPRHHDERDARREAYLPEVLFYAQRAAQGGQPAGILHGINITGVTDEQLIAFFFDGVSSGAPLPVTAPTPITCEEIIDRIFRDMSITFHNGNQAPVTRDDIRTSASRRFIPVMDGSRAYAVYTYANSHNNIESSFRTSNILVERPNMPNVPPITIQQVPDQIRLEPIPEISFTPTSGSFRIGHEAILPTVSTFVHHDSDVYFDQTAEITNYTFIQVRFRPFGSTVWQWIGTDGEPMPATTQEDASGIMRIDNFRFEPTRIGNYQFWYYTTTIFGVGNRSNNWFGDGNRIREFTRDGVTRPFIATQPFLDITIERDNQAPELRWTADFDYDTRSGQSMQPRFNNVWQYMNDRTETTTDPMLAYVDNAGVRHVAEWGNTYHFEDTPDRRQWLPGSTGASRTQIAQGESLVLPALLGYGNATPSHLLDYQLFLYRYENDVRSDDYIFWSSGLNGDDPNLNGGIWNHSRTFHIPFTEASFNANNDNPNALLAAFRGFSIVNTYSIMVRAYDENGNISAQMTYRFDVVPSHNPSRPTINNTFRATQNEYHEGDLLRFNLANFTDLRTADTDIEVRYFLSLNQGLDIDHLISGCNHDGGPCANITEAVEIRDGDNGVRVVGGVATVELTNANPAGRFILNALSAEADGFLTFRIYAVARNYHAITRGFQVGETRPNPAQDANDVLDFRIASISRPASANPPNYIAAVFDSVTIYDMSFGAAAHITDNFYGENSWYTDESDPMRDADEAIAIPALRFFYPSGTGSLFSTITYSVTFGPHTRDAHAYRNGREIGAGWQGTFGEGSATAGGLAHGSMILSNTHAVNPNEEVGDSDTQRYFYPMGVGVHYITVRVTNAGGNIAVFVGTITVVGTPHPSVRLLGDRETTMDIGGSARMPGVEIIIDHQRFVTGADPRTEDGTTLLGQIVTADDHPHLGRPAIVGTFVLDMSSENRSPFIISGNNFTPHAVDTYRFSYFIEITDTHEFYRIGYTFPADHPIISWRNVTVTDANQSQFPLIIIPSLDRTADPIRTTETWRVSVNPLQSTDMFLELNARRYRELAEGSHGFIGGWFDRSFLNAAGDVIDNRFVEFRDPTLHSRANFFTDMLVTSSDTSFTMSDEQLWGGLEPFIPTGTTEDAFPTRWQYGRIFIPRTTPRLASGLNFLSEDFTDNATQFVTVTRGATTLLDSRDEDNQNEDFSFCEEGLQWFRPAGMLYAQYAGGNNATEWEAAWNAHNLANPSDQLTRVEWAQRNATNKMNWEAVATAQNNFMRVDGEYVITYTLE